MPILESCIRQEQKKGCGAACLATVLGVDYWYVARAFHTDLNEEGLDAQTLMDYLSGFGFDIASLSKMYYGNGYNIVSERILKPFADIHIIASYQSIEATKGKDTAGHWQIMDSEGTIFCPSIGAKSDTNWLVHDLSIGIWYPRYWKYKKERKDALNNSNNSTNSSNSKSTS